MMKFFIFVGLYTYPTSPDSAGDNGCGDYTQIEMNKTKKKTSGVGEALS